MLMTDGVGKAGGQSVQRRGSIRVLRNISIPTERIASTMNPQRFVNSYLFSVWSTLTPPQRQEWVVIASGLTGKNIWGDDKTYSGREAFLMCNGVFYPYLNNLIDTNGFDWIKPTANFTGAKISANSQTLLFTSNLIDGTTFFQIKAIRNRSAAVNPKIDKLKTFFRNTDISDPGDNFAQLELGIGAIAPGDFLTIAIRGVSQFGLVSPWNIFNVEAT